MTTNAEALRAQFERKIREVTLFPVQRHGDSYIHRICALAWECYQAGHAAAKAETAAPVGEPYATHVVTTMEKFSYLLCRNGCSLYFAVLEQPEEWRTHDPRATLSWEGFEGRVRSAASPKIGEEVVYLRGCNRGADRQVQQSSFADEHAATEKEAHVRRLLAEFVQAGGFSGKRKAPKAPGVVTTFSV